MPKSYDPESWELEMFAAGAIFEELLRCINFVEGQIRDFDDRTGTQHECRYGPSTQIAFLLVCVAQMEAQLKMICEMERRLRNYDVGQNDLRGSNGFDSCIAYLDKVLQIPISADELRNIRAIVSVRNVFVHHDGYVGTLPSNLGSIADHISIDKDHLVASGSVAQEACVSCRQFVQSVANTIETQHARWRKT